MSTRPIHLEKRFVFRVDVSGIARFGGLCVEEGGISTLR